MWSPSDQVALVILNNAIRLAFALYEPDTLAEGIHRIAAAHREAGGYRA
jgi:DNA-binding transcriptional MocR family regulator